MQRYWAEIADPVSISSVPNIKLISTHSVPSRTRHFAVLDTDAISIHRVRQHPAIRQLMPYFECHIAWHPHSLDASDYTFDQMKSIQHFTELYSQGLTGKGVKVGVTDTGVFSNGKYLQGRIVDAKDFTGSPIGAGDKVGHGSMTASQIAVLCPDAQIYMAKGLGDSGSGGASLLDALNWLVAQGCQVLNNCLPGETEIATNPRGPRPIRDIQPGDNVFSYGPDGPERRRVVARTSAGIKKVYRIRTRNRTIEASDNHPFLVALRPGGQTRRAYLDWRPLSSLRKGDAIVVSNELPQSNAVHRLPNGLPVTPEFMRFIGAYLGDGYVTHTHSKGSWIGLCVCEADEREFYSKLIERIFGRRPSQKDIHQIVLYDTAAARLLSSLGFGDRSYLKQLPEWVFAMPRGHVKELIEGFIDTDGYRCRYYYFLGSTSDLLIRQLRYLAISIGYQVSNISVRKQQESVSRNKKGVPIVMRHPLYTFQIYPNAKPARNFHSGDMRYKNTKSMRNLALNLPKGFELQSIQAITYVGEKETFDIAVEGSHNFIAQGIVVHNSWGSSQPTDGSDPFSVACDDIAAGGVLVIDSAGNSGPGATTIGAPAAGKKQIAVGAVDNQDVLQAFSSRGPTLDGRIDPAVVAAGKNTYGQRVPGSLIDLEPGTMVDADTSRASGTSFSGPNTSAAAVLLKQKFPDLMWDKLKAMLQNSADWITE